MKQIDRIKLVVEQRKKFGGYRVINELGFTQGDIGYVTRKLLAKGMTHDLTMLVAISSMGDLRKIDRAEFADAFDFTVRKVGRDIKVGIDNKFISMVDGRISEKNLAGAKEIKLMFDEYILFLPYLDSMEKVFYSYLRGFNGYATMSNKTITRDIGLNKNQIAKCIKKLKKLKFIETNVFRIGTEYQRTISFLK